MDLDAEIRAAESNPQKLEQLYQDARQNDQTDIFQSEMFARYEADPENLLFSAWFYRLQHITDDLVKPRRGVNWIAAVVLSILTGLIFWALSDVEQLILLDEIPHLVLWWSIIATMSALVFLALTSRNNYGRALALGLGLLAITVYTIVLTPALDPPWMIDQYILLAAIHLPLLCWIALGISVLGFNSSVEDRFAFLKKSIEVMMVAGLYLIAGLIFGGITVGMF